MITDPVSIRPSYAYAMLAVVLLSIWGGAFHASLWIKGLALTGGIINFLYAGSLWVDWFTDRLTRRINFARLADPAARIEEAKIKQYELIRMMDTQSRAILYGQYWAEEEPVAAPATMRIGADIFRKDLILTIGKASNGLSLRPERDWTENTAEYRRAYIALDMVKAIRKGDGSSGPVIRNVPIYDEIMAEAAG